MGEQEHHDDFYLHDAAGVFDSPWFAEVRRRMVAFLAVHGRNTPRDRVLSLGCGDGRVECLAAGLIGEIVGIEISPVAVQQAQARAQAAGLSNLHFTAGDIQQLELAPASFDAVWTLGVLHHLEDAAIAALLRRSLSLLRPGGRFVSNDPSAHRLIGLFRGLFSRKYQQYHSPDERELDAAQLVHLYRAAGFDAVAVHYNDFFLGPFSWLFPTCPAVLVRPLTAVESLLLEVPGLRNTASSFCIVARKPG
jgi:SAM-dependent methyltransferase